VHSNYRLMLQRCAHGVDCGVVASNQETCCCCFCQPMYQCSRTEPKR